MLDKYVCMYSTEKRENDTMIVDTKLVNDRVTRKYGSM